MTSYNYNHTYNNIPSEEAHELVHDTFGDYEVIGHWGSETGLPDSFAIRVPQSDCLLFVDFDLSGAYMRRRIERHGLGDPILTWPDNYVQCIYCGRMSSPSVPQTDEDWDEERDEHKSDCEWIVTRAHSLAS